MTKNKIITFIAQITYNCALCHWSEIYQFTVYNDLKLTSVQWGAGGAATPGAHQWGVKIDTKTNTTLFHCKTLTSYRFGLEYTPDGGRNN